MTALAYVAQAVHLALSLFLLWVLMFLCWRSYRVDALRDRLFALRDQVFDYAATGAIEFDHPAYGRLRGTLNSMIRFAHRITFGRLVLAVVAHAVSPLPGELNPTKDWLEALETVPSKEARERLLRFHQQMIVIMVRHMITGSPVLWLCFGLVSIWMVIHGATKRAVEELAARLPGLDLIESQAIEAEEEARRSSNLVAA